MSGREDSHDGRGSPLIIAAYRQSDPSRKRRVKVPPNIKWADFLDLFYNRFGVSRDLAIEIYDEKGIEIVSTDDLLHDDVLVVKEVIKAVTTNQDGAAPSTEDARNPLPIAPPPSLEHFIQASSLGYYFLGKGNSLLRSNHGRLRQVHCIVKVPHPRFPQPLGSEAALLSVIAGHKGIIAAPSLCTFSAHSDDVQNLSRRLTEEKRKLLQDLISSPGHTSTAYVYPLYGVTMATKIKTELVPGAVLRYSYQLADIMHYLEEKGVIHLNLLPENIQVMSNDRIVLCNFETAIRTDQSKQLVGNVANIMMPKNKKSLAPEIISALTDSRSNTGTVDFSGQYAWNFGVLVVLFSTGQHPLRNYPEQYDSQGVIKYKSVNYQALPDPNKYPPLLIKIVRRALSCDPIRRPSITQILSLIKRDTKILSLMAEHRETQVSSSRITSTSEGQAASPFPLQSQQTSPGNDQPALSHTERPNGNSSPDHCYENFAMKWYMDDPSPFPQGFLSPFQDQLSSVQDCFPSLPSSNHLTVSQCQPSNSSLSLMSQNPFPLPTASQGSITQDSRPQHCGSQSISNPDNGDLVGWFPSASQSQHDHNQTSLKTRSSGSLSALNTAAINSSVTKITKDDPVKQFGTTSTPHYSLIPSHKQATQWEEVVSSTNTMSSNVSAKKNADISSQISPTMIGNSAMATIQTSTSASPSLHLVRKSDVNKSGADSVVQRSEREGSTKSCSELLINRGAKLCKVSQSTKVPCASGLLQWTGKGGSGPLWPSRVRDPVCIVDTAASSPDLSATALTGGSPLANSTSKQVLYRRRRSFSGFVPASLYTISTAKVPSEPKPPVQDVSVTLPCSVSVADSTTANEGSSASCAPCLDPKKQAGQSCMSPIPEASQEVPSSSQIIDHLPITSPHSEEHTSPFRHEGLVNEFPLRTLGPSTGAGGSTKGPVGAALVQGASVGALSLREMSAGVAERSIPATEEGVQLYPNRVTRRQTPNGPKGNSKTQRQQHMSWDLEVLNRAYSDMDLARRHTPDVTMTTSPSRCGTSTADFCVTTNATRVTAATTTTHARHASHQIPMERVLHNRQTPSLDVTTAVTSASSTIHHAQVQLSSSTHNQQLSQSQHTISTIQNSHFPVPHSHSPVSHSHSPVSHSHSPPSENVLSSTAVTSSPVVISSQPTSSDTSSTANALSNNDIPSFRDPPPSYDEIFGSRSLPRHGQNHSHTLPARQTVDSTSGRHPFASFFGFFKRMRRRESIETVTPSTTSQQQSSTQISNSISTITSPTTSLFPTSVQATTSQLQTATSFSASSYASVQTTWSISTPRASVQSTTHSESGRIRAGGSDVGRNFAVVRSDGVRSSGATGGYDGRNVATGSDGGGSGATVSDGRRSGAIGSDGGRSGATGSDGGRSGATGSDGGRSGATGSDGGRSGAIGSDGGRSGAIGSDGGRSGATGSDGGRSGATGSDGGRSGATGSDGRRSGATGSDGRRSGATGSDGRRNGTIGSDSGRSGAIGSDGGRSGAIGSDGRRSGAIGSDGGRSGVTGSDGGRSGSDGGRSGVTGSDGGRSGSDGGRSSTLRTVNGLHTHTDLQQGQEFVPDRRVNPPYRPPPPFIPASTRDGSGPTSRSHIRSQSRGPQFSEHDLAQGTSTPQLVTGSDHRSLYLSGTTNSSQIYHDRVQLRTANRRGLKQRPHSEMIPNNYPPLVELSHLEESEVNSAQAPFLLQSSGLSTSCMDIQTSPGQPPSSQERPNRTRLTANNNVPGPNAVSVSNSNNPTPPKSYLHITSRSASSSISSNMSLATSFASAVSSSVHLATSTSSIPSTMGPVSSSTMGPVSSSNISSALSSTFLVPSNVSNISSVPTSSSLSPANTFSSDTSTSLAHMSIASDQPISATCNSLSVVPSSSVSSHNDPNLSTLGPIHTSVLTPSSTSVARPNSDSPIAASRPFLHIIPTYLSAVLPDSASEPYSSLAGTRTETEAQASIRDQRSPQLRNPHTEQAHVVHNNTLHQPSIHETVQEETSINRDRKSCGHLCLKQRRFCCLCGHREVSLDDSCLLCIRHSTGNSTLLRSLSIGDCHSGNQCTCDQNEICCVHQLALSQPLTSADGSRRPASQNCVAM